ncbi:MFS transporter [bacterium]|nr:MFS transporter [bacterium]
MKNIKVKKISPLAILNLATFLQYQRFVMPISFLFYIYNGLNFSDFILCQSIYCATCLLGKFMMGFIGDIISKKYVLIIAYILFMVRVILWINFSGFWIVMTGEILYGLFKALYRGNVDSYIYEYLEQKESGKEMTQKYGTWAFYTSLGSALSCIAGVILYKYFGFKTILFIELITQIIAVLCLLLLPNTKIKYNKTPKAINYVKNIFNGIKSVFSNSKINYNVYYAAMLAGFTSIFVWNFQPLLKLSSAPVILYGVINFINQIFRAIGGLCAEKFALKFKNHIFVIEYIAVIVSFILLIAGYYINNYIFIFTALLIICIAIILFMIFNVFNVSNLHKNTQDVNRATSASVNSFAEDFTSFFLLINFKFIYDKLGIHNTLAIFIILAIFALAPVFAKRNTQSA